MGENPAGAHVLGLGRGHVRDGIAAGVRVVVADIVAAGKLVLCLVLWA